METRVFRILFVAVFATMLGVGIIEPLMGIYAESLGANGFYVGLIFAAFAISRGIFTPLIGKLSDHWGRRNFIIVGMVTYTLLSFLYVWGKEIHTLVLIRFLHGFASALVVPVGMAYIGDISPHGQEGKYLGTFITALFLGIAAGPFIGGTLSHLYGMDYAFLAMGTISFFVLVMVFFFLPETGAHKAMPPTPFGAILKHKTVQAVMIFRATNAFGISALMGFLPLLAMDLKMNTMQIGTIVTVNILITALLQRFFGRVADRGNKMALIVAGGSMVGLSLFLLPFAKGFYSMLAFNAIMGLGSAVSIPASSAITARLGKQLGMGSVMGLFNTAMGVGDAVGPLAAGAIMVFFGIRFAFISSGAFVLLGICSFYLFTRKNALK